MFDYDVIIIQSESIVNRFFFKKILLSVFADT